MTLLWHYINGDNDLQADKNRYKMKLIEREFKKLMFDSKEL
jgi:hypothetical protein